MHDLDPAFTLRRRLPRPIQLLALLGALLVAGTAVACGDGADEPEDETSPPVTSAATETATPPGSGSTPDATQAVPEDNASLDAYAALVSQVAEAFPGVALIEDTGAFEVGGGELVAEGRRVLVFGTAAELPTHPEIAQRLRGLLEGDGWAEDQQYTADGPTGTFSVWTKGADLAVLSAGASPRDPEACPADQLVATCLEGLDATEVSVQGSISVAVRSP